MSIGIVSTSAIMPALDAMATFFKKKPMALSPSFLLLFIQIHIFTWGFGVLGKGGLLFYFNINLLNELLLGLVVSKT